MSSFDTVRERQEREKAEAAASFERAARHQHHLLQLSSRRWAVIRRTGHTIQSTAGPDIFQFEMATEPASYATTVDQLRQIRGGPNVIRF